LFDQHLSHQHSFTTGTTSYLDLYTNHSIPHSYIIKPSSSLIFHSIISQSTTVQTYYHLKISNIPQTINNLKLSTILITNISQRDTAITSPYPPAEKPHHHLHQPHFPPSLPLPTPPTFNTTQTFPTSLEVTQILSITTHLTKIPSSAGQSKHPNTFHYTIYILDKPFNTTHALYINLFLQAWQRASPSRA